MKSLKPRPNKYDLIEVFWRDIKSTSTWTTDLELYAARCAEARATGYFHSVNSANELIILHNLAEDGDGDYTIFPLEVVDKVDIIREVK